MFIIKNWKKIPVIKSWGQNETKVMCADRVKQNCRSKHLTAQPGCGLTALTTGPRLSARLCCPTGPWPFPLTCRPSSRFTVRLGLPPSKWSYHSDFKLFKGLYLNQNSLFLDYYLNNRTPRKAFSSIKGMLEWAEGRMSLGANRNSGLRRSPWQALVADPGEGWVSRQINQVSLPRESSAAREVSPHGPTALADVCLALGIAGRNRGLHPTSTPVLS